MDELNIFFRFALSLAMGLLIGLERGWHERHIEGGVHMAGMRTFGLIGLLGAIWAQLASVFGELLLGIAFLGFAALMIKAHTLAVKKDYDYGLTTIIAALITFGLGALMMKGYRALSVSIAVVVTGLLSIKPVLHQWVDRLEQKEVYAIVKLLLISVVILPILPDEGFGPWQALNPYKIWWMVVLIAAISFVGYFAMRIAGPKRGLLLTAFFGGFFSSTAVTLSFAKKSKENPQLTRLLSSGILIACGTMFPRVLILLSIIYLPLAHQLALPLLVMACGTYFFAFWLWKGVSECHLSHNTQHAGSFELKTAFGFGLVLTAIMFFSYALKAWMGDSGIYLLAFFSGISDVDAITLTLSNMVQKTLALEVATGAILLAVITNTLVKAILAFVFGDKEMVRFVTLIFIGIVLSGVISFFIVFYSVF